MLAFNIHEAKTHLSRLVEDAAHGKSFIIAKAGKPMVKVVPFENDDLPEVRRLGFMAGEVMVPDDFDLLGEDEIVSLFERDGQ